MATLRVDGYAGFAGTGTFTTTTPINITGSRLIVTADVEVSASLKLGLVNAETKQPIKGFGLDDCAAVTGDVTNQQLMFPSTLKALLGQSVLVQIRITGGRSVVYTVGFATPGVH